MSQSQKESSEEREFPPELLDALTRQDELLRAQLEVVRELKTDIDEVTELLELQNRGLAELTGIRDIAAVPGKTVTIEFSTDVPASTGIDSPVTTRRAVPFDGEVIRIIAGWPDGAANLAGIGLKHRSVDDELLDELFPFNEEDSFIAANDFTSSFNAGFDVESGQVLVGEFINNDTANNHFLNLMVTIREE